MKLLFDANVSPKPVVHLSELFPQSTHVFEVGLERNAPDEAIWQHALINGFTIVTADSNFLILAELRGWPPKVVQLAKCNYRTSQVESLCDEMRFLSLSSNSHLAGYSSSGIPPEPKSQGCLESPLD